MADQFLVAFVASLHVLFHIVATQFQINTPQQPLVIWSCGSRLSHRRGIVRERELSVAPTRPESPSTLVSPGFAVLSL